MVNMATALVKLWGDRELTRKPRLAGGVRGAI